MNTVKIKSYAKVNLTVEITGVKNGFHTLDSLVASIDLFDLLHLKKRKDKLSSITMHGMGSEGIPPEKNNALKAAEAFSAAFGTCGADITVYKNIPIGAGLGGSSADIVGVLNGMAKLYGIQDRTALKTLADTLGSDTGYMLTGGFARMQGRGEKVTALPLKNKLYFLLICPNAEVSAGGCYRKFDELSNTVKIRESATQACIDALMQNNANEGGRYLMNDLYIPATQLSKDVETAYNEAKAFSPLGVVMSGSGSCVYAWFETKELCEWAQSRYKGRFRTYVTETVLPDYLKTKPTAWKNPFVLSQEEQAVAEENPL